jgi:hypothetical protein
LLAVISSKQKLLVHSWNIRRRLNTLDNDSKV